eukprot:gene29564-5914_t
MVLDYARAENGASIIMATAVDERFPPENLLDGKDSSFWMTTGMFPQEVVLALKKGVNVSKITTLSMNVNKMIVEKCDQDNPMSGSFEKLFEVDLPNRGDRLQTEAHQVSTRARFLKFVLVSGHGEFAVVNRVSVVGTALDGDDSGGAGCDEEGMSSGRAPGGY